MKRKIILASASPRRRELLVNAGFVFDVRPVSVDETRREGEAPDAYVLRLAEAKARAAWRDGEITLGADTTVAVDAHVLEKPQDRSDARRMLEMLSGREHHVLTGFSLFDGARAETGVEDTKVVFRRMTSGEIADYAASGEPLDKAGAYGIQGLASKFVERIEGCYFNVVGLPVARVDRALEQLGR